MAARPIDNAGEAGKRPQRASRIRASLSRAHVAVALALWLTFSALTFAIVSAGLDDGPGRLFKLTATTAGVALGPMTGAISRDFQPCCLTFSLGLLPFCSGALIAATAVQWVVPGNGRWRRIVRLLAWAGGLLVWFAGGIVSFGHALG